MVPAAMIKVKYWVKMMMMEGTDSWVMRCEQIGEAKLFSYILSTYNQNDASWTMTVERLAAIKKLIGIEKASVYNYLKHLVKAGLLLKTGRGHYKVNEQFVSYGNAKK